MDSKEMDSIMFIVTCIICIAIVSRIQAFIHEGGHYIFGKLTGYKFVSFRVGTYMVYKKDGELTAARSALLGTGGQCLMSPPDLIDGIMPFKLYNLGGAILNLISALLYIPLWTATKNNMYLNVFGLCFMVTGVIYSLLNGLPLRNNDIDNDGSNTMNMCKCKKAIKSFWMQLKVSECNINGTRIKDLPEEWFFVPEDEELKNTLVSSMAFFYKDRLLDKHKFSEAAKYIDHILGVEDNGILPIYKKMLIMDRVYIELIGDRNEEVINKFYTQEMVEFRSQMKNYPPMLRTEYALSVLEKNNVSKAEVIIKTFNEFIKIYPYEGEAQREIELVDIVKQKSIVQFL